uniref:VWFA domain-containing protein n=1 Tax=Panagrolaimus sp. JU765 TaxID=591449 RepID=A0AC34R8X1_9BILA
MKLLSTFLFIIGFYIKFVNSNPHQQYTCPANCVDVWGDCQDYVQFCQDPKKGPVVRSKCPCTCQVCSPPPTLAPSTTTSTMKPTTKPLLERYKCRPVNIIFVLDNSESIDDAFFNKHIDDFVNDVAGVYPMKGEVRGPSTRVGIVQFGSSANVTYPLIERTRNEFNPRITYSNQGSKNITLGLETALVEFQGQGIGRDENVMVVLVTNVITTLDIQQTSGAVSRVREYSSFFAGVGINGFNGNEISSNLTNLIELIGNKALAFPDIWSAGSYGDGIPPKSLEIYPCKASLCKGVIFIGEMTEIIGQYRKEIFLNSTKQIAAYLDANPGPLSTPEELQFSIAIYGNQTIRPIQLQSFAEFNRDLDILI